MNLSAEHVSVLRGRTEIVHDVSFSVSDGQWLMICGPNGAGKSTLLSAVSQELPYTGLVTLDGTDLRRMKPRQLARRMAMLRQLSDLAYAYTVEEVVAMGRYAHRGLLQADNGGAEAVERALQAVQLQDKRRQNILTLSGGELQRVLLALALHPAPDLLVLDEPVSGVDQNGLQMFLDTVVRLKEHHHMAILLVSHDLNVVRQYADHVVLLDKTVLKQGKPDDVFASPEFQKVFGLGAKTLNAQRLHGAERWMGRKAETPEEEIARAAAVVDDETKGGQA